MAMPGRPEPPGRPLAAGRSADVYDLGGGRILRRYHDRSRSAEREAKIISWAGEHGVPVPEVFDAAGPDIVMADDFVSATRAAAFGGNTFVMPYCLQAKGQPLREALKDYHALAEQNCHIDHSFHLIIAYTTENVLGQELPALVADRYTSFKVFVTYADLALSDF